MEAPKWPDVVPQLARRLSWTEPGFELEPFIADDIVAAGDHGATRALRFLATAFCWRRRILPSQAAVLRRTHHEAEIPGGREVFPNGRLWE